MIAVLVGNENAVQRFWRAMNAREALSNLPSAQAGVNQQARPLGGNQRGVARTRRRDDGNFDQVRSLSFILELKTQQENRIVLVELMRHSRHTTQSSKVSV